MTALSKIDLVSSAQSYGIASRGAPLFRIDFLGAAVSEPPVVTVSPASGSEITRDTVLTINVDDDGELARMIVVARYDSLNIEEVVHQGDRFGAAYVGSKTTTDTGYQLLVMRSGGWPAAPAFDAYAIDSDGGEAS